MRRGEIRWYAFKGPDKRRPVLILTRDTALEYLGGATIAPITTTIRDIPSEVILTRADGMPHECAVNLDHVQTVPKSSLGRAITALDGGRWVEVQRALLFALGF